MVSVGNRNIWLVLMIIGQVSAISYNRPKFYSNATWNPNGTTVVNSSTVGLQPFDIFINTNNIVYVTNREKGQISQWSKENMTITRNISGLNLPRSLFVTESGIIYADNSFSHGEIDRWTLNSSMAIPVMYTCGSCYDIFIDISNTLYCSMDASHKVVAKSLDDPSNAFIIVAGTGINGSSSDMLYYPNGIFVDINFDLYVADGFNNRIQLFRQGDINGITVAGNGSVNITFTLYFPSGIVLDADGYLFITDMSNHRIVASNANGFRCLVGCSGSGSASHQLNSPRALSFDSGGNMYITDTNNSRVQMFLLVRNSPAAISVTLSFTDIFWSFDNNYNDLYNDYNGVGRNNPSFHSPGYTGYGSALALTGSSMQYVLISNFLNMTYRSFTWEMWAYPTILSNNDYVMVAMCDSRTTDRCLHIMIRNYRTYFAFWGDDCIGTTIININQWYHFAFVYNYTARTQYFYLNGIRECQHNASGPFLGNSGSITIGAINSSYSSASPDFYWTGYIDQVSYVPRAKTSEEILTDATLVAYYSFDNASFNDLGPNKINGTGVNISSVHGRVNEGILFNNTQAYFQANGFTLLGSSYRSYSIALWIYRFASTNAKGTILHMVPTPSGVFWCMPIIGLTSSNEIVGQNWNGSAISVIGPMLPLEVWTHVVTSYNPSTGISLWVNGTFIRSSGAFIYAASNVPNTVTLGSSLPGSGCGAITPIDVGQFYGMMDELRIYSRELNASEIHALANP